MSETSGGLPDAPGIGGGRPAGSPIIGDPDNGPKSKPVPQKQEEARQWLAFFLVHHNVFRTYCLQ